MNHPFVRTQTPSPRALLARILESSELLAEVQALPPPVLARVIDAVGLEDAGELVACATTEQLVRVFDEDLWRSERPGEDARFDGGRFALWLTVMLEAGDTFVAARLAEMPEELLTLALHSEVLVLPVESVGDAVRDAGDEGDYLEKAISDCLSEELDDYLVLSRHHDGWDAILAALLALDRDHHDLVVRLLERCAAMSADHVEDNGGLYDVLTSEEMLEGDVAAEREDRRAAEGHVAPPHAVAFLKLARTTDAAPSAEHDPTTRAWFRGLAARPAAPPALPPRSSLHELLVKAGVTDADAPPPRLGGAAGADAEPLLTQAMQRLAETNAASFTARSEELAYLANVLAAGCALGDRRLRPIEAVRAALATCNLGLLLSLPEENAAAGDPVAAAATALVGWTAESLFRVAWRRLDADVVRPARAAIARAKASGDAATHVAAAETLAPLASELPSLTGPRFISTPRELARAAALAGAPGFRPRGIRALS